VGGPWGDLLRVCRVCVCLCPCVCCDVLLITPPQPHTHAQTAQGGEEFPSALGILGDDDNVFWRANGCSDLAEVELAPQRSPPSFADPYGHTTQLVSPETLLARGLRFRAP